MSQSFKNRFYLLLRTIGLSLLVGIFAGTAAALFLISLAWVTDFRNQNMKLIWFLPFAGFFIVFIYKKYGRQSSEGTGLILEEIHSPKNRLPLRMAPFVFIGTLLTHLFGGSAGREGTVVQIGATLSDQLSRFFHLSNEERKSLLMAGAGAGFSAAIGAPIAGTFFGIEMIQIGRLRLFAFLESIIASFIAYYVCQLLGAPHTHFFNLIAVTYNPITILLIILAGLTFGLTARVFIQFTHLVKKISTQYIAYEPLRPLAVGFLIVGLYYLESSYRYVGLGLPVIQSAFTESSSLKDPFMKTLFTGLTIGSGFKGGEFIPLVFIGTTLGSFLSTLIPVALPLLAALGFAAVFGAAANTPIACALMAGELFGWTVFPYALLCCWVAYYISGHVGIYNHQKVVISKKGQVMKFINWWRKDD